jgi:hypothetical protein
MWEGKPRRFKKDDELILTSEIQEREEKTTSENKMSWDEDIEGDRISRRIEK